MPRDPSGNYTLPALGNPALTNTPITIAWWNGTSTDMASTFTDSLSRTGQGGMLVPFKLVNGTVGAPAFSFQSEPNTGIYLSASGDLRVAVLGADVFKWTATAISSLQGLTVTGGATITGAAGSTGLTVTGGSTTGRGGTFTAVGAEQGLVATGGTGGGNAGTWGIAGAAGGIGAIGQGVSSGLGVLAYSSATTVDVLRADGYVDISHATDPASTTAFTNRLTPKNLIKAWGVVTVSGGDVVTVVDGFNVASVSYVNSPFRLTVTLASAMANTNYGAFGIGLSTAQTQGYFSAISTTVFGLVCGSSLRSGGMMFIVLGAQ